MGDIFHKFSRKISELIGSPAMFFAAFIGVLMWTVTGIIAGFTSEWQLLINTITTISTFLTVFLIQNTQNRDAKATHLKLDELIRAIRGARLKLVDIEELTDGELEELQSEFRELSEKIKKMKNRDVITQI